MAAGNRPTAGRQSTPATPTVGDLTGKLNGISIQSGSGSGGGANKWGNSRIQRSPASASSSGSSSRSSPAEELVLRRGQHERRQRNPAETTENGGSRQSPLEEEELGSGGSGRAEKATGGTPLSREQREAIRFKMLVRKKDFRYMERVNGRTINVLQGLELHTGVFSSVEQKRIVDCVYDLQEKGRNNMLRARTYSEPRKWMRGKGRVTIQFGCCYNYAVDKKGNPPGIIRDEEVDPIPPLLKSMIKRMVAWHVLPPDCIPNSCIVNIYDEDDCIPPHIDHHDFVRPFCTVSFLSECNILFGRDLKVLGPGEFSGSTAIPLPVGSVLILSGNGADVAKHCVPAVPAKRISITFRKMDDSKLPFKFSPDPDLQNLQPLAFPVNVPAIQQARSHASPVQQQSQQQTPPSQVQQVTIAHTKSQNSRDLIEVGQEKSGSQLRLGQDDFPPLGSTSASGRTSRPSRSLRQ